MNSFRHVLTSAHDMVEDAHYCNLRLSRFQVMLPIKLNKIKTHIKRQQRFHLIYHGNKKTKKSYQTLPQSCFPVASYASIVPKMISTYSSSALFLHISGVGCLMC
eukprot:TRINITY_DN7330_c2_g1_i1.p1 TRINITY_DN7330_c2_g1~~TRINITY_DN7330_c2_g1_i1.p1  ORF type:complete len:105 (+),score=2.59 TRINITY_DN7330_c2_g1_i1:259-573(+)